MNVILKDTRKTVKFSLPSYPDSQIETFENFSFQQMYEIQKEKQRMNFKDDNSENLEIGVLLTRYLIKDWNLVGEDGKKMPVSMDTFGLLEEGDALFLIKKVGEIYAEAHKEIEKKK